MKPLVPCFLGLNSSMVLAVTVVSELRDLYSPGLTL